jgi:uncharacterized delta-60 repeat protein
VIAAMSTALGVGVALAAEGDPDPGWDGGQAITVSAGPTGSSTRIAGLARQADGKVVILGNTDSGTGTGSGTIFVERLTTAGQPDPSFGSGGIVKLTPAGNPFAGALLIQPSDQKLVIAASADPSGHFGAEFIRLNPNGTADSSFGSGGTAFVSRPDASFDQASALAIASDGTLYAAGSGSQGTASVGEIASVSASGTANPWASGGILIPDTSAEGPNASFSGIALSGGDLFFAGEIDYAAPSYTRYGLLGAVDATGKPLSSFGSAGLYRLPANTALNDLLLAGDGKLKATGFGIGAGPGTGALIASFTTSGASPLDPAFGNNGVVIVGGSGVAPNNGNAITEASGNLYVAATALASSTTTQISLVAVNEQTGALDTALGPQGFRVYSYGSQSFATAIADDPTKIEVGGQVTPVGSSSDQGVVSQYDVGGFGTVSCNVAVSDSGVNGASVRVGTGFRGTFSASGGTAPYTYTATGGLPPGLTLDSSGTLSGTPTASGTYAFTVVANDSGAFPCSGQESVSLTVTAPSSSKPPPQPQPVGANEFIIHKQVCHDEAAWALHHAQNGGLVSVIGDELPSFPDVPVGNADPNVRKEIGDVAKDIAKETSSTVKDGLDIVGKVVKIVGKATSVVFYVDYYRAEACAQDPPDPNFTTSATVQAPPSGPFLSGPRPLRKLVAGANALIANAARFGSLEPAMLIDYERTQGAAIAGDATAEHARASDTAALAQQLAALVRARGALRAQLVIALRALRIRLTIDAAACRLLAQRAGSRGLPVSTRKLIGKLGVGPSQQRQVVHALAALKPTGGLSLLTELNSRADAKLDGRLSASLQALSAEMSTIAAATAPS